MDDSAYQELAMLFFKALRRHDNVYACGLLTAIFVAREGFSFAEYDYWSKACTYCSDTGADAKDSDS